MSREIELTACIRRVGTAGARCQADNRELAAIFAADQRDRRRYFAGKAKPEDVQGRDFERRTAVRRLIDEKRLHTANDYYHAAMILHHGVEAEDFEDAHGLARIAARLSPPRSPSRAAAKWLVAATFDRTRMKRGDPQWYGTQFVQTAPGGPWRLFTLKEGMITDAQRKRMNVPTLEETYGLLEKLNSGSRRSAKREKTGLSPRPRKS